MLAIMDEKKEDEATLVSGHSPSTFRNMSRLRYILEFYPLLDKN